MPLKLKIRLFLLSQEEYYDLIKERDHINSALQIATGKEDGLHQQLIAFYQAALTPIENRIQELETQEKTRHPEGWR